MRCAACNRVMTDVEMTLKAPESGQFTDLCTTCYRHAFDYVDDEVVDTDFEDMVQCHHGHTETEDW